MSKFLHSITGHYAIIGNLVIDSSRVDTRLFLYSLIFYNTLIIWVTVFLKGLRRKVSEREKLFFLFSSVTLFGYLQAFHLYNLFRLQNSSSLGIGLLIFSLENLSTRFKQWKTVVFSVPVICLIIYLSNTLVFTVTSSTLLPWNKDLLLSNRLKEPENIEVLQGKLYDTTARIYYQTLAKTLSDYSCQLDYLVNLTRNTDASSISESFKMVQRSPFYVEEISNIIFQDEQEKIAQLLKREKAILVAQKSEQIPKNYQVVLKLTAPQTIIVPLEGAIIYVAVPSKLLSRC